MKGTFRKPFGKNNPLRITYYSIGLLLSLFTACRPQPADLTFRNWATDVHYTGSESCRPCHPAIFESFSHSEMGNSIAIARPQNSAASFGPHALVYDETKNFYYFPFWQDSLLFIREFRLKGKDTTHLLEIPVKYIIGSGQHTNSHITERNGYLFQAPITFYTQSQQWDLAPGFAHGGNERFFRSLELECLACHSDRPRLETGTFNRYINSPQPIGCERCHGPGSLHIAEKKQGIIIDTAKQADLSIVRPSRLSRERLMDLCQRCHLQGISVLAHGKNYTDFRPGMKLHDYIRYFLPRYTNSDRAFIMASQADRLRMSKCYQKSAMSCLDCHNPHHSIRKTKQTDFIRACQKCHNPKQQTTCSRPHEEREKQHENCISCHMPSSGTIDIPHVRITDHYIRRNNISRDDPKENNRFLGLELLTGKPTPLLMAQGYLTFHEKYNQGPEMLDSALFYLQKNTEPAFKEWVYYHFAKKDYKQLIHLAENQTALEQADAYTCYRIGEAFMKTGNPQKALLFFEKALKKRAKHPPFLEKKGVALIALKRYAEAEKAFLLALALDPARPVAMNNLGYLAALQGRYEAAEKHYQNALRLNPDYAPAWLNLGALQIQLNQKENARKSLQRCLELNPGLREAQMALEKLL